jgi:D-alanine-D-alanine ligase
MTRESYLPTEEVLKTLEQVTLDLSADRRAGLYKVNAGLLSRAGLGRLMAGGGAQRIEFDVAIPCFHGLVGEDGQVQGALETAKVDKVATKRMLAGTTIEMLPFREIKRPVEGLLIPASELAGIVGDLAGPWIIKPTHLGSSIGVAKVATLEELADVLPTIFQYDTSAILEPFVENMVEYNVAVARIAGAVRTSAIERPKRSQELLDFKEKYLSGGGKKTGGGGKTPGQSSQGMLSLTRELNPKMAQGLEEKIRAWAAEAFEIVNGTGAPRIDFIGNEVTGEIWLNEVNPCPGSFGYFLWEAMAEPILFSELLDKLIAEALSEHARQRLPHDPTPNDARLFQRR